MNGARLGLSLALVALPALALPAVRRSRRPQTWALLIAVSLGAGFVLIEASLIHAALPLAFTILGMENLAEACRSLGGHLFGDPVPFSVFAGLSAIAIGVRGFGGVADTVRAHSALRRNASSGSLKLVGNQQAVFLPLQHRWAVAIPGGTPQVVLSSSLIGALEGRELDAVVHHEVAHLEHHHVRFLLLGTAVTSGLWFLPWMRRAGTSLRLALERWADELASAESREQRASVQSALRKLDRLAPSALASHRLRALEESEVKPPQRDRAWSTVAWATVPMAIALAATLVLHLVQVLHIAGAG